MKRDILFWVILCILSSSSLLCFLSFGTICTFVQPQVNFYYVRRERRFYFLAHIRGKRGGGGVHRRFGLESTTVFCKNTLAVQSGLFTCQAGKGRDLNSLKEANIAFGPQFNSDFTKLKHLMRIICVFQGESVSYPGQMYPKYISYLHYTLCKMHLESDRGKNYTMLNSSLPSPIQQNIYYIYTIRKSV